MVLRQILHPSFLIGGGFGLKSINKKAVLSYFLAVKNKIYCSAIYDQLKTTQMSSSLNLYKPSFYSIIWQCTI